jgi:hypothetical protein
MARRLIALIFFYLLCWNAQALDARQSTAAEQGSEMSPAEQAQRQKRRENLREATKFPVETVPPIVRQLSPQERWELREQLRQQRQDGSK